MPPPKTSAEDAPLRGQRPLASLVRPPISQDVGAAYAAASGRLLVFTLWVNRARMGPGPISVVSAGSLARRAEFGPTIQVALSCTGPRHVQDHGDLSAKRLKVVGEGHLDRDSRSLDLAPADRGFVVLRSYEAVDDPADVRKEADGTWHIKAGSRVRVRLTMVADARRTHVALVDPIPAGLEAINPALAVSESVPADAQAAAKAPPWSRGGGYWWWWRPWYEHENLRDERVEAFASLVWAGVYDYSYVARATTPGAFVVPPTKAEEMYHPETFGRSGTDKVVVEP